MVTAPSGGRPWRVHPARGKARNLGFKTCFHCGEGPAENIASMVTAGSIASITAPACSTSLIWLPESSTSRSLTTAKALTSSRHRSHEDHPFARQLDAGALVTLSDDPAFFASISPTSTPGSRRPSTSITTTWSPFATRPSACCGSARSTKRRWPNSPSEARHHRARHRACNWPRQQVPPSPA